MKTQEDFIVFVHTLLLLLLEFLGETRIIIEILGETRIIRIIMLMIIIRAGAPLDSHSFNFNLKKAIEG